MQKIPIEYYNLNLFERLDRPVIAFVKKKAVQESGEPSCLCFNRGI